jgi:hypothetical protein
MGNQPITLFTRIADPAGVARLLRERVPSVEVDGPDDDWRKSVVVFGERRLTLSHDPQYYAEPNWSVQMNGMREYLSRFPDSDAKQRVMMLTTTFKFALGTVFDPD